MIFCHRLGYNTGQGHNLPKGMSIPPEDFHNRRRIQHWIKTQGWDFFQGELPQLGSLPDAHAVHCDTPPPPRHTR